MRLMGVDVGFSKARKTTGIACLDGDNIYLRRAGTPWESRKAQIPEGFQPDIIAIDGPLLPKDASELIRRRCEVIFIQAPFCNRCKPGLSHWGNGLELRRAAAEARAQFSKLLGNSPSTQGALLRCGGPVIEAFPNAFLAVLLAEEEFGLARKLKRGKRFDWVYERAIEADKLKSALSERLGLPDKLWCQLRSETNHELRAALVCLLTAVFAAQGTASTVGDAEGGWFWLPPFWLWQGWVRDGLSRAAERWHPK
jgi:hypothetical protein